MNNNRVGILDLLRFLSALSVVFYHFLYRGWKTDNLSDLNFNFYDGIFKYGYLGVQVFFIISGFVIYLSIEKRSLRNFFISRFTRLYPTYWLCLTITLLFIYLLDDGRFFIGFINSALNYLMFSKLVGVPFADGAYWTLIYELCFYFWVFVSLFFKKDRLLELLTIFSVFSLLLLYFESDFFFSVFWGGYFIGYFLLGCIFFKIYRNEFCKVHIVYLTIAVALCFLQANLQVEVKNVNPGVRLELNVVYVILSSVFVFFFLISKGYFRFLNLRIFWHLGVMTYPCYLLHQNVGYIIFNKYGDLVSPFILLSLFVALLLFFSYLIGRFCEPFLMKKSKHILGSII